MSHANLGVIDKIVPFGTVVRDAVQGIGSSIGKVMQPKLPATEDLPQRAAAGETAPPEQLGTRDQQQRVALAASGITSTENQRDQLGSTRRAASRLLLGGR